MANINDFTGWKWQLDLNGTPKLHKAFFVEASGRYVKISVDITSSSQKFGARGIEKLETGCYSAKFNHPACGSEDMGFTLAFLSVYQQAVYETAAILESLKS